MTSAQAGPKGIGIYHRVYARESFGNAADKLLILVRRTARAHPGVPRHLYLDIDGHRKRDGWDADADALLAFFVPEVLGQWLTVYLDAGGSEVHNPAQREDVPDGIVLTSKDGGGPVPVGMDEDDGSGTKSVILVAVRAGARLT